MINCLITGGTGFIGSNLVRRLVSDENTNIFLIVEKGSDLWRLKNIISCLTILEADLLDFKALNDIVTQIRPNFIFHLASYGGLPNQSDQRKIFDINFYGTVNLLNACKNTGFDCFINTGSSSEYGIKECTMKETDIVMPVSDYGVAKTAATQLCVKEALFNKLPVYTIRPFSVYGDYEMPGRLISTILLGILNNTQINLASPNFVRDFIYVQDIVDIYLKIAALKPTLYIFNAGTGIQSTIGQVVATVESIINSKLDVNWNASTQRPWEPGVWQADMSLVNEVLDWHPKHSLRDGLEKSLEWFKQSYHSSLDPRFREDDKLHKNDALG